MLIAPEQLQQNLTQLSADELRQAVTNLLQTVAAKEGVLAQQAQALAFKQATIDKLTFENAYLKRLKFAAQSERYNAEQRSLLEETLDADLQAVNDEIEQLSPAENPPGAKLTPKRAPLPAGLPRVEIRHEPDTTTCACGCQLRRIGEDVAEKLDYVPGVLSVERHIRGKWACAQCETLTQAPVEAHIIDKGIPTFGICLGHQIMALASGAKTFKMKFGHHGANHPVKDLDSGRVSITSQNHGFAVDEKSLPANLRATHVSLFDGTIQGLQRTDKPAFCFQGHPEASPGPQDISYLFDRFIHAMETH
jgi:hypothetical protein